MRSAQTFKLKFSLAFLTVILPGLMSQALQVTGNCNGLLLTVSAPSTVQVRPLASVKQLKIVTYNLEDFRVATAAAPFVPTTKGEGALVSPKDPRLVADQVNIIDGLDPDIAVFEEVYDFDSLKAFMGTKYTPFMVLGNDSQRNIGFVVKSDLPLFVEMQTHKSITWNDPDENQTNALLYSRDLPVLLFRTAPGQNPSYIFIGNHGKSQRNRPNDNESKDLRTAQYQEDQKLINQYRQQYPNAVILMAGDFNADVRTAPEVDPIRQVLKSPFDILNVPHDQRTTEIYFNNQEQPNYSQLDNIFISANGASSVQSVRVVPYLDSNGQPKPYPKNFQERSLNDSDHYPVELIINTTF